MTESRDSNQGYSLIELVATLAIVSIIAVFAIPTMNQYLIQGKVADAIQSASSIQTRIVKEISAKETVTNSGLGLTIPTDVGSYVSGVVVSDNGVISITMDATAAGVQLNISPVYNSSSGQVSWTCTVANSSFNQYVPSSCRI